LLCCHRQQNFLTLTLLVNASIIFFIIYAWGKKTEYLSIFSGTYTIWTILKMILGRNTSLIVLSDSDQK
jgi:hypothetical protein